jgi:hypothetical protein
VNRIVKRTFYSPVHNAAPQPPNLAAGGILGAPFAAGAPLSKFSDFYSDASVDEYNHIYGPVMAVFASALGGTTPQQI